MSIVDTVYNILIGDNAIVSLLGKREDGIPAIFNAYRPPESMNPLVVPYITYQIDIVSIDPFPMQLVTWEFDIWDSMGGNNNSRVNKIAMEMKVLLDHKSTFDDYGMATTLRNTLDNWLPDIAEIEHRKLVYAAKVISQEILVRI